MLDKNQEQYLTRTKIRRLASNIAHQLEVSGRDHLVWLIGSGHERDNIEAIETWLRSRITQRGLGHLQLSELCHELMQTLRAKASL